MRRRLVVVVIVAAVAVATAAAVALRPDGSKRAVDAASVRDWLELETDPAVTPVGSPSLVPGGQYTYEFRVTNTGPAPVRQLVVHTEKVIGGRAGEQFRILSVSEPSCRPWRGLHCQFDLMGPGESRTVKVKGQAEATRHPGDVLTLNTFLAAFAPANGGQVSYDVLGERQATKGIFRTARSRAST
ncbi:hypothetical protein J4573_14830 [Actinomadura barringtoniae]|uniref:DUF11 domain-containing protein n=1 Tax=Actinomadura barringtoniae TaxID=1427535 RepID=A0A939P943_9ACTN|nr:hypothetical protein [Actinomadura barringtoniae]MBO2448377.1 hypothetical protein [Actinomadura barringtoniae]